jgi:AmmeMemoRadiSam system protein A
MSPTLLDRPAQEALLRLACDAVARAVKTHQMPPRETIEEARRLHSILAEPRGVFATIYIQDRLRGCLGEILPDQPLALVATRCANRAAWADRRFAPIRVSDLPMARLKLSVLTPPEPVPSVEQVVIGRDGLIAEHEGRAGVFLPEVPVEQEWDLPTYLRELWRKAGIHPSVPVKDVRLSRFQSQVIDGDDFPDVMRLLREN